MCGSEKSWEFTSDEDMLNKIKKTIADQIMNKEIKGKVGDLLKILELQKKLGTDENAQEKFWEMIEKIRQEELKDE